MDSFICVYLSYFVLFLIIAFESLELSSYVLKEGNMSKGLSVSKLNSTNAAVNGYLELTLLKGRQRFDAISTSNLEVCKFGDWWIFT